MNIATILIIITGIALLLWTIHSIRVHLEEVRKNKVSSQSDEQSVSEQVLNNVLLYVWLAFMIVFSVGMMCNNFSM